jgi:CRP-like cAMP-binding protein
VNATAKPFWENLPFAEALDESQRARLAAIADARRWDAGERIFREGDTDSPLYLIEEGRVAIELTVPERGGVTILTVGPGEVFGWSSLFQKRPKSAAARAVVPTSTTALDSSRLRELCDADPVLGYAMTRWILEVVSERLKTTRLQLLDVFKS